MTWGVFRPCIALPIEANEWAPDQLEAVLQHEIAHIERRDAWTEWLCQWLTALQWWNPLVWLTVRKLRIERENACDDWVLASGSNPKSYASAVLEVAAGMKPCHGAAAMAQVGDLESRLTRIMSHQVNRQTSGIAQRGLLFALLAFGALSLAWIGWAEERQPEILVEKVSKLAQETVVVIDPGHGGYDLGANQGRVFEKHLNLDVAKRLKANLEKAGVPRVVLTREGDQFVPLLERSKIANEFEKAIFVSLHFSSAWKEDAKGKEIFYGNHADFQLAKKVHGFLANVNGEDRGVNPARFSVLKNAKHPAILIEGGFLSNREDKKRALSEDYRQDLANAVSRGIMDYFGVIVEPVGIPLADGFDFPTGRYRELEKKALLSVSVREESQNRTRQLAFAR